MEKISVIVEGGGMRGMYAAGILDCFIQRNSTGTIPMVSVLALAMPCPIFLASSTEPAESM